MENGKNLLMVSIFSFFMFFGLAGCQILHNRQARSDENLLAAAGFRMKPALTPAQLKNVQQMKQRTLIPQQNKEGQVMFIYADAGACKCIYIGTEKNHQEYQKLVYKKKIAEQQLQAAQMNREAMLDWESWGPWDPWDRW